MYSIDALYRVLNVQKRSILQRQQASLHRRKIYTFTDNTPNALHSRPYLQPIHTIGIYGCILLLCILLIILCLFIFKQRVDQPQTKPLE